LKGGKVQYVTGLKFADNFTQSRKVGDVSRNERQARFLSFVKGGFASVETDYFLHPFQEKPIDGG
jgi:hypothetical protein